MTHKSKAKDLQGGSRTLQTDFSGSLSLLVLDQ